MTLWLRRVSVDEVVVASCAFSVGVKLDLGRSALVDGKRVRASVVLWV